MSLDETQAGAVDPQQVIRELAQDLRNDMDVARNSAHPEGDGVVVRLIKNSWAVRRRIEHMFTQKGIRHVRFDNPDLPPEEEPSKKATTEMSTLETQQSISTIDLPRKPAA